MTPEQREGISHRIRVLESDLRDSRNPAVLKQYPHLGEQSLIDHIEKRLRVLRAQLESNE